MSYLTILFCYQENTEKKNQIEWERKEVKLIHGKGGWHERNMLPIVENTTNGDLTHLFWDFNTQKIVNGNHSNQN